MNRSVAGTLAACGLLWAAAAAAGADAFAVKIEVDAAQRLGEMKPVWRFFGCDEPNYATMKDGRRLLAELGQLAPGQVFFRAHNLLCSGDGTPALKWGSTGIYAEDAAGQAVFNWAVVDHIFDTYLERGVRPYVEIGFMPQALSTHPLPYQHEWRPGQSYDLISAGWAYPPKDYRRWEELAYRWAAHCVEKYGRDEAAQWYWEVWNEADGRSYWHGSREEFCRLHDFAVAGVRRALPTARVGGPDSAGGAGRFTRGFLEHCLRGTNYATGQIGTPLDFVSFHAKGSPEFTNGHVRMGIANQLRAIDAGFALIAEFPQLRRTPIVIGESDPDGCAACTASVYPQNNYRNGALYAAYTAATFGREQTLADRRGVNLEGALTWAFEFEDQPYFAGFRALASDGIDLPVLNVFRMLRRMRGQRVAAASSGEVLLEDIIKGGVRGQPDVAALASLDTNSLAVLVWHYHDDDIAGPEAAVELTCAGLPAEARELRLSHYRIDDDHSNAFTAWKRMGAPAGPDLAQYRQLVAAGALAPLEDAPRTVAAQSGQAVLRFTLPRQAVSLVVLEW
ncbi:MAG: beta-xylosidase [Verrucomicrobiota bacterium]|jgi:xylan 1,4-beta-xylosidase